VPERWRVYAASR